MTEASNQQTETTVVQMDDAARGVSLADPDMAAGPSAETSSSSGQLAACCPAFLLRIVAIFSCCCSGDDKSATDSESNASCPAFLLRIFAIFCCCSGDDKSATGIPDSLAIISSDTKHDTNRFIQWQEDKGEQLTEDDKKWTERWLPRWNMFLQARAGHTLVTRWSVCLTIVGFIFYIVDLVSDVGTSVYYAANGQWWQAMATLTIVYGAVIFHTVEKWRTDQIPCAGAAAWLRYVASSLVNWPDLEQYGALCQVEWQLCKSPACSAHLVPEWHQRRVRVVYLKYVEGVWEACPQAILQLCLLVPDLYGHWTWTDYLRIAGACVSLCTAGAALVNWVKLWRINSYTDLPLSELAVLLVWAVSVTVSRLMSVTLLLSVHLYWALAGVALHLVLYGVCWCRTVRVPRTLRDVIDICGDTLQFFMTPFSVTDSVTYRRVRHAVHFLVNTGMMVVWALSTLLVCVHPALYTAIICFNAAMFAVGLVAWQLHEYYWPGSYFIEYDG